MTDPARHALIEAEYFKLQDVIEKFDERALQIKGWSVTVSLAAIVAAYASDAPSIAANRPVILWVALLSAVAFWYVEFAWKCFQWSFLHRITEIEAYMRAPDTTTIAPLQIRQSWRQHYKAERRHNLRRGKFLAPSVALPHAGIIVTALCLIVDPLGWA